MHSESESETDEADEDEVSPASPWGSANMAKVVKVAEVARASEKGKRNSVFGGMLGSPSSPPRTTSESKSFVGGFSRRFSLDLVGSALNASEAPLDAR